jgi:hypothetical protein
VTGPPTAQPAVWAAVPWWRFGLLTVAATALYAAVVGVLAGILPNPVFHRVVPVDVWNLLSWLLPAVLFGALAATYLVPWPRACRVGGRAGTGGVLSFLAAGCPVCNKLVVLAVGTTGALDYFRPLQPLLGLASLILLAFALWARLRIRAPGSATPGGPGAVPG